MRSASGCGKDKLHMKKISVVDSLLVPVTSLVYFSHILTWIYVFYSLRGWPQLEQGNFLLPTDSLATVIPVTMPFLADWDRRSQMQIGVWPWITLPPAPVCTTGSDTMNATTKESSHDICWHSEWSELTCFPPEAALSFWITYSVQSKWYLVIELCSHWCSVLQ